MPYPYQGSYPYTPNYPTYFPQTNQFTPQTPIQQPVAQPSNPSPVRGRVISAESEILPNEILMDGSITLFPLADNSAIIAKQWTTNGSIQTTRFIPEPSEVSAPAEEQVNYGDILKGMDSKLDSVIESLTKPSTNTRGGNKNA